MRPLALVLFVLASGAVTASSVSAQGAGQHPHGELPEGLSCTACHTTQAWSPLRSDLQFDHDATDFRLDGAHGDLPCVSCHEDARFDEPDLPLEDCASCHLDVHMGSIQGECIQCHTTTAFTDIDILMAHPGNFSLEGAHLQITCESCHRDDAGGAYSPLETECQACHIEDFGRSLLVDHITLGFPTDCQQCHTPFDWRDAADFDHTVSSGGFELLGRHREIDCLSCHSLSGGGVPYQPTDATDCLACHLEDYQGEHLNSGYPTTCLSCHTVVSWDGARFDHGEFGTFPLNGAHRQLDCTDCHANTSDFGLFACLSCHEHSQAEMDPKHKEVVGYVWESNQCLSCHTGG